MLWHHILHWTHFIHQDKTMLWQHKASLSSFFFFYSNNVVTPQNFIVLISFITTQQCCGTTEIHCNHFIYYHKTMLWHNKASLSSFIVFSFNNVVITQSFIVFLPIQQCCDASKLPWSSFIFFPSNSVVTPQTFIVFVPMQQCCDTTKLHCTYSISSHKTMPWYHKASLYSFYFFLCNNAVAPQSFIVLISVITIQQCCGTTNFHCPHYFLPIQQCCDTTKLHSTHLFITIQQCRGTTKLHCLHSFSSHPTILWHHKSSLYSLYFFPYNNAVAPQSFIVLILFLPNQQYCDITKLYCAHSIFSHTTML